MPWTETRVVDQRTEFVLRALRNVERFGDLCQEFEISRKTGYKWKQRFLRHGLSGLGDRSRRPASSPQGVGEAMVCQIVKLRTAQSHVGSAEVACGAGTDGVGGAIAVGEQFQANSGQGWIGRTAPTDAGRTRLSLADGSSGGACEPVVDD